MDLFARMDATAALETSKAEMLAKLTRQQVAGV
jgi:hypothetical protein